MEDLKPNRDTCTLYNTCTLYIQYTVYGYERRGVALKPGVPGTRLLTWCTSSTPQKRQYKDSPVAGDSKKIILHQMWDYHIKLVPMTCI